MVGGINDVHNRPARGARRGGDTQGQAQETYFYSGHHWDIAPLDVIGPTPRAATAYHDSVAADLALRSPSQIERILSVMAESNGGRQILFTTRDPTFLQALAERLRGDETAMLARVRARVVTPFEGGSDDAAVLRRELRDHGFYD
jgi:hypothetical protein